jgi:ATP-dependent DNA helicase RecG
LASYPISAIARERLGIIRDTQDGFEIARRDLLLRGPGEFVGARQSGLPMLRFADVERDKDLVQVSRELSQRMVIEGRGLVDRHLDRWFGARAVLANV